MTACRGRSRRSRCSPASARRPRSSSRPPAPAAASQQPASRRQPTPQQPPVFRAGINFVRVDVIVSDKNGNPVADLKPADFEVTEDGKPQKIETFKLVKLDGGAACRDQGAAARDPHRRRRGDRKRRATTSGCSRSSSTTTTCAAERAWPSREQLARFIETQLGPSDMVGVMYPLESIGSVRMTRNHAAIIARHAAVPRPQVRLHAEERVRGEVRVLSRPRPSSGSATRCRCRRSRR